MIKIIKKYKYALITCLIIAILLTGVIMKRNLVSASQEEKTSEKFPIINTKEEVKEEDKTIKYVEIKGAVYAPGVYPISDNARVTDIVKVSGGLTDEADTTLINMSRKLEDEDVIIIYTKEEVASASEKLEPIVKVIDKECICPKVTNDACLKDTNDEKDSGTSSSSNDNSTITDDKKGLVNINTASVEELMTLTGIGESKAKAIIEYRTQNGNFKTPEDITNVKGIGEAVYAKIKAYITT